MFGGVINFQEIFSQLLIYHYMAFALLVFIFLFLFILAIMARRKPLLSAFLFLLALFSTAPAALIAYLWIEHTLRGTEMQKLFAHRLEFSDTMVLTGELKNTGRAELAQCKLSALLVEQDPNTIRFLYSLSRPIAVKTLQNKTKIAKDDIWDFRWPIDTSDLKNKKKLDVVVVWKCF